MAKIKKPIKKMNGNKKSRKKRVPSECEEINSATAEPQTNSKKSAASEHKETLERLRETDPEFYEYLKAEDAEVFDFDVSDDSEDELDQAEQETAEDDDIEADENEDDDQISEQSSDDEQRSRSKYDATDDADDDFAAGKVPVTLNLTERWHKQISKILENPSECDVRTVGGILNHVVDAFRAVLSQTGAEGDARSERYRIDDAEGFNAVIRLCIAVYPAVWHKICGPGDLGSFGQKKRKALRPYVKPYLHNLAVFLDGIQHTQVLHAVLKHLSHVVDYYSLFGTLTRSIIRILVKIWSTKDEDSRLLAFISIMKLVRRSPGQLVSVVLKKMYLAYVRNTKSSTPVTWRQISFMQRSYAEICGVDKQLTYQFAFVYIRQLAIHLRNAIVSKKKEQIITVYNWQFIQCLYLWARVLAQYPKDAVLQPLVYPLIQIALGCVKLIPTAKYIPLRFHCLRAVLILVQATNVYVPLLPVVLEAFQLIDFKKKHQRQSLKPLDFDFLLKLSQSQLEESALKPAAIEGALELIVEIMNASAGSVAFPELAFICCSRLKSFHKSCHITALARPAKELSDKISEHAAWMERRRNEARLDLAADADTAAGGDFEKRIETGDSESPMSKYYETFKTMKERERKLKSSTEAAETPETEEPVPTKQTVREKRRKEESKNRKPLKKQKLAQQSHEQVVKPMRVDEDEVRDLNLSDLDD